ncbi:hypothetical protein [Telmatospirillum sp. J64-1]|uniref:hypothetical protein n=1 Tax=Telmatospirillum sp. J64-1 TaxID=2502183 RepID=UPI00115D862F|nr:hypothetical protein [Telmatospirillum sp. J64-1]
MSDLSGFQDRLDIHGAELAAWPEEERRAAEALLARSAEARALLDRARHLDGLLSALPVREAGPDLRARIAAIPARSPRRQAARRRRFVFPWPLARWQMHFGGGAAMAASVLLGLYVGAAGLVPPLQDEVAQEATEMASLPYEVAFELEEIR